MAGADFPANGASAAHPFTNLKLGARCDTCFSEVVLFRQVSAAPSNRQLPQCSGPEALSKELEMRRAPARDSGAKAAAGTGESFVRASDVPNGWLVVALVWAGRKAKV